MTNAQSLTPSRKKALFSALLAVTTALTTVACGHENKLYRDPDPPMVTPAIASTQPGSPLPQDFFDQSINLASSEIALDGTTTTSIAILLETKAGTSPAGGFNGSGTGHRAVLGIAINTPKKLSALTGGITFDAKTITGSEKIAVSILVDLDCTGTSTRVLTALGADLAPGTAQADSYTRFSADFTQARWLVSGSDITDPGNPATILVPGSGSPADLTALISKYPNACIHNAINADDALAKGLASAGVLLTLGTPTTTSLNQAFINRVTIGSTVHAHGDWGSL